jgi:hypothetical protein
MPDRKDHRGHSPRGHDTVRWFATCKQVRERGHRGLMIPRSDSRQRRRVLASKCWGTSTARTELRAAVSPIVVTSCRNFKAHDLVDRGAGLCEQVVYAKDAYNTAIHRKHRQSADRVIGLNARRFVSRGLRRNRNHVGCHQLTRSRGYWRSFIALICSSSWTSY